MEVIVACNEQAISERICSGLHQLGIECPASHVLSQDPALALASTDSQRAALIVFFGSAQFLPEELSRLKQLCTAGADRIKVVAVGPATSPQVILQAVHCGAVDYLDINNHFEGELHNLLQRIKTAQGDQRSIGRLFTVVSHVGGTGASVVAINLAAALAQKEKPCGLLDFQLRGGDLALLLKSTPRHTLLSLADKANHLDRMMFDQALIKHDCGIHLLASPEPFANYKQVSPQVTQKIVQFARTSCPNVVVDLEDVEHPEQVRALAASDKIIVPLRLDFVSLCRTKRCIDHLLQSKVSRDRIVLVANRVGQPKELEVSRLEEVVGLPVAHQIPDDPSSVNESVNLGVPLVVSSPKSKVSLSIIRLADSLLGIEAPAEPAVGILKRLLPLKSAACLLNGALLSFNHPLPRT